jgi:diphthine-ammonia ligase
MMESRTTNDAVSEVNEERKGNVVVSWTGGKDGCFACYTALLDGFNVTHLLSFKDAKRTRTHEITTELLAAQSESMGLPMIYRDFISYEEEFKKQVRTLNQNGAGIEGAVFGHIDMHEDLVQRMCSDMDIESIMPL